VDSRATLGSGPTVSVRLVQVPGTYCGEPHPGSLRDLRAGLEAGQSPWPRGELAAAIRVHAQASGWWVGAVGGPDPPSHRWHVRPEQRRLWRSLFPTNRSPLPPAGSWPAGSTGPACPATTRSAVRPPADEVPPMPRGAVEPGWMPASAGRSGMARWRS
jgi:hypothetical protein